MSIRRRLMMMMGESFDPSLYAVTKKTNPSVMAICYAKGWAANENYMTFEEAAAVTNAQLSNSFYNNKVITHFEEFQYFTNITSLPEDTNTFKAFRNTTNLSTIKLPASLTRIQYCTFMNSGITSIDIPNSVTSILGGRSNWKSGGNFADCTNLVNVKYSSGVSYITGYMFYGCRKLKNITNIEHITKIGGYAFRGCSSLEKFTIPQGVTAIGGTAISGNTYNDYTFYECSSLTTIICLPSTPPTLTGSNNFPATCTIYVPDASLNTYQTATGWSDIASQIKAMSELQN